MFLFFFFSRVDFDIYLPSAVTFCINFQCNKQNDDNFTYFIQRANGIKNNPFEFLAKMFRFEFQMWLHLWVCMLQNPTKATSFGVLHVWTRTFYCNFCFPFCSILFFLQRYQINNYLCEMFLCINDNDKITQEREQTKKSYTIIYNLKHCHFSIPLKFQYHPIHQSPPIGGLILHSDTLQHKLTKC